MYVLYALQRWNPMKTDKPDRTYLHNILYYNIILYGPSPVVVTACLWAD